MARPVTCASCGQLVSGALPPAVDDEQAWTQAVVGHTPECPWVLTRAWQREDPIKQEAGQKMKYRVGDRVHMHPQIFGGNLGTIIEVRDDMYQIAIDGGGVAFSSLDINTQQPQPQFTPAQEVTMDKQACQHEHILLDRATRGYFGVLVVTCQDCGVSIESETKQQHSMLDYQRAIEEKRMHQ